MFDGWVWFPAEGVVWDEHVEVEGERVLRARWRSGRTAGGGLWQERGNVRRRNDGM